MAMYKVDIHNNGGYLFKVKSKDYSFMVDTEGKGITPPDALLASLGSCIGVYVRKYAEGAKLDIGEFDVTVEAEFAKEKPVSFKTINVSIALNSKIDEDRKKALLAFVRNCPVHNTLESVPAVEIELK